MFVNLTAAALVATIDAENSKILGSSGSDYLYQRESQH